MAAALVAGLPGGQAGIDGLASMLALQPQLEADLVKAAHAKFGNAGVQQAINKAQWQVQGTADGAVALAPAQAARGVLTAMPLVSASAVTRTSRAEPAHAVVVAQRGDGIRRGWRIRSFPSSALARSGSERQAGRSG